jgi:hypothetical protein
VYVVMVMKGGRCDLKKYGEHLRQKGAKIKYETSQKKEGKNLASASGSRGQYYKNRAATSRVNSSRRCKGGWWLKNGHRQPQLEWIDWDRGLRQGSRQLKR